MRRIARFFAGPMMAVAGIAHFVVPRTYASIIPDVLPGHLPLVYASGAAELLGALGTMHPRTRRPAGWLLIGTLVVVFPANVNMALNPDEYSVPGGLASLIARLPLQALFVYWVWLATIKDDPRETRFAGNAARPAR